MTSFVMTSLSLSLRSTCGKRRGTFPALNGAESLNGSVRWSSPLRTRLLGSRAPPCGTF